MPINQASTRSDELEERIHELEGLISDIEAEMANLERALDFEWMTEQSKLLAEYESEVSDLYDKWMDLQ